MRAQQCDAPDCPRHGTRYTGWHHRLAHGDGGGTQAIADRLSAEVRAYNAKHPHS